MKNIFDGNVTKKKLCVYPLANEVTMSIATHFDKTFRSQASAAPIYSNTLQIFVQFTEKNVCMMMFK